jgi:hypothetical protein
MKRIIFSITVTLLACTLLLSPTMSQAKTGVIMHDHGAPGKIDHTADPYIGHDDNFKYGLKLFLRHMIMMHIIPNITIGGPPPTSGGAADIGTTYFPVDHLKGHTYADYECAGGSEAGLNCYVDSDCDGGTCDVSLNIIDSISTGTDTGSSASLTETGQDFSFYKSGDHVILAGTDFGTWWGFIGAGGANDTVHIYNSPARDTRGWCGPTTPGATEDYWLTPHPSWTPGVIRQQTIAFSHGNAPTSTTGNAGICHLQDRAIRTRLLVPIKILTSRGS